jgi:CTP synthase (UTP-ammonia lyase)
MDPQTCIALVGDCNPSAPVHQAIPIAIDLCACHFGVPIGTEWIATKDLPRTNPDLSPYAGLWCVPASPYQNPEGALAAIRWALEQAVPFLGTCGGFQHAIVEYARNVLGIADADHAETNPSGSTLVIAPLVCSLLEVTDEISLEPDSLLQKSYGTLTIREGYHCSYGPNRKFESTLFGSELRITARDAAGEIRGAELRNHPFFVGTLFQLERRGLKGELSPVVREFTAAALRHSGVSALVS